MFGFLYEYGIWVDKTQKGIVLKEDTPRHIVELFDKIKAEQEEKRKQGIIID
jgi:hypothetical protein